MLSGCYEYFGFLNIWVPPPDTDELAEQGLRFWTRVTPDIPFMGFSTGRFFEVASKLGIDPADAGLVFKGMPGFGLGKGMPLMTAGAECFAYLGGGCGQGPRRPPRAGLGDRPGRRPRNRCRSPRRRVGQPRRDDARPRQRFVALRPRRGVRHHPRTLPVRRDDHPRALGRSVQGPHRLPGPFLPGERGRVGAAVCSRRRRSRPSNGR